MGAPPRVPKKLPKYELNSLEGIKKRHQDIDRWLLTGQLSERIAGTAVHNLEAYAKILMPSEITEALDELRQQAHDAKRDLEHIKGLASGKRGDQTNSESGSSGSSTVDSTKQDP